MNLEEFTQEFIQEVRNDSIIQGMIPSFVFLEKMLDNLQDMEYIFNPTILQFFKSGTKNRIMKFDAYSYDEIDKSFDILSNEYIDDTSISSLSQTNINQITSRMLNFIDESNKGTIFKYLDPSNDVYKLAMELRHKLSIDYISNENDISIDKIKLFVITNKRLSNRISNLILDDFLGRRVELNVWDIERIFDVENSGREKEPIFIDIKRLNGGNGIPYLKADFKNMQDYDAYLSILPGKLLSDIYWDHGSRLLEGNVRAFLSIKGKINSGIRKTIKSEPGKFFTYNNGIACTAKKIHFSEDSRLIEKIEDLQIINGGQTTASLTSAWKKDSSPLENIYVPMKLTIIKSDDYDDMIQNISKYANSQNKVTDADLFSNHAFHRRFEILSQKIIAPPKRGESYSSYWFYERSRGKYQQLQFKLNKKSDIDAFKRKYPKKQVIVKEDLAKFIMAAEFLRPDLVSRGRARNMNDFAKKIDALWKQDKNQFNEVYFKKAICYAILYKKVDEMVAHAEWYNKGGIKLNIVPYTISKIMYSIPKGMAINFNRIWKDQELYDSFLYEIGRVSKIANDFINNSKGMIVTEFAKKEDTWSKFKNYSFKLSNEFIGDLIDEELIIEEQISAKRASKSNEKISIELEIYNLSRSEGGKYWERLLDEGIKRRIISPTEDDVIRNYICELSKDNPKKIPSPAQFKMAWDFRKRLEKDGVLV